MPLVPFMISTSLIHTKTRRSSSKDMHDSSCDAKAGVKGDIPTATERRNNGDDRKRSARVERKPARSNQKKPRFNGAAPLNKKLPVTILSGFLGAGKSTLLKYLLTSNDHKMKIAVIVNDMAELNIDAKFVENSGFIQTKQEIISLQNGCICCTLRTDLIREINNIQRLGTFDYLIIESTGIAEPMQVAESFVFNAETMEVAEDPSQMLWNVAKLDTCVSVVDASLFPTIVRSTETVVESFPTEFDEAPGSEGFKHISQLLIEQVEFANVIVLNKIDLLKSVEEKDAIVKLVKTLNPSARIVESTFGRLNPSEVLNTGLFDMDVMSGSPGWLQSLTSGSAGEKDEYGISSFVYRARRPFHPERFRELLVSLFLFSDDLLLTKRLRGASVREQDNANVGHDSHERFGSILRSKGFSWIAGRDRYAAEWNHNGRILSLTPAYEWYCLRPEEEWEVPDMDSVKADFAAPYGDRRQEIVFIGTKLVEADLTSALNNCLLTDEEMSLHDEIILISEDRPLFYGNRNALVDPLPVWADVISETTHWTAVLRPEQQQTFQLTSGVSMQLRHISLDFTGENVRDAPAIKVWLDSAEGLSLLLCTLRPGLMEQCPMTVSIPAGQEDSPLYLLRLELAASKTVNLKSSGNLAVYVSAECVLKPQEKGEDDEDPAEEH